MKGQSTLAHTMLRCALIGARWCATVMFVCSLALLLIGLPSLYSANPEGVSSVGGLGAGGWRGVGAGIALWAIFCGEALAAAGAAGFVTGGIAGALSCIGPPASHHGGGKHPA